MASLKNNTNITSILETIISNIMMQDGANPILRDHLFQYRNLSKASYKWFGFPSLEKLCDALQLPTKECSCEKLGIIEADSGHGFCDEVEELKLGGGMSSLTDHPHSVVLPALITLVAVFSLMGNISVIWFQTRRQPRKKNYTLVLTFLAISDIFFAILNLVYHGPLFSYDHWIYGLAGCKILGSVTTLGAWISIGIIMIIAVERFNGIVYPFKDGFSKKMIYICLAVNLLLAICLVLPRLTHLTLHAELNTCREDWVEHVIYSKVYDWLMFIIYFIVPIIAFCVLYTKIFKALKDSTLKCTAEQHDKHLANTKWLHSNRKTIGLLLAVLIAFIVCTLPNKIRWLIMTTNSSYDNSKKYIVENDYLMLVTEVMYSVHLAINPFIYAVSDKKYRVALQTRFREVFWTKIKVKPCSRRGPFCLHRINEL